jgi:hypothetical protein
MVGGAGDDQFVVTAGDGNDTIIDFVVGGTDDRIVMLATSLHSFTEVVAASSVVGGNLVITYNGTNSVTLNGVGSAAQLSAGDFIFI